ncbi:unnamed protein product [Cunninghamella blakesleeana]
MFSFFSRSNQQDQSLQDLIESEKKLVSKWVLLADERRIAADNLVIYGRPLGDDLTDVTSKMGNLLSQWSKVLGDFAGNCDQYQLTLKSIAERESRLLPSREKRKKFEDQLSKLKSNNEEDDETSSKINEVTQQLNDLKHATATDEREMDNFKRIAVREAFYLLLNGMHEMASKTDVLSSFGKYIVDELDVTPVKEGDERQPYKGSEQTHRILNDATYAIENWKPDGTKVRRTLTSHHGRNPLVSKNKALPPSPTKLTDDNNKEEDDNKEDDTKEIETKDDDNEEEEEEEKENNDNENEENHEVNESLPTSSIPNPHLQHIKHGIEKQDSVYSLHKPDAVDEMDNNNNNYEGVDDAIPPLPSSPRFTPASVYSPNITEVQPDHTGGFSTVYLGLPDHQKLYQFYTNYTPPKSYDDMAAHLLSPQAVFHPSPKLSNNNRIEAGGFALPSHHPHAQQHINFLHPQPSISASSVSSHISNGSNGSNVPSSPIPSPTNSTQSASKLGSKISMLRSKFQND